jgi:hypothetical protein
MRTYSEPPLSLDAGPGEASGFAPLSPCAHVVGAEGPLAALLQDVLRDEGVQVAAPAAEADVVLAVVARPDALAPALRRHGGAPVIVLLPFAQEGLQRQALGLGARGCFALGEPLERLRALVRGVLHADFAADAHGGSAT